MVGGDAVADAPELGLFSTGKFGPPAGTTLVLLLLLLVLLGWVGVQCAFGILPLLVGVRTVDGSMDKDPKVFGSPASAPEFRGEEISPGILGVTGLLFSLKGLVLELGVISMLSSRIRTGLFASCRLDAPPPPPPGPLPGPPFTKPPTPLSKSFVLSLLTTLLQFSLLFELLLSIISVECLRLPESLD